MSKKQGHRDINYNSIVAKKKFVAFVNEKASQRLGLPESLESIYFNFQE